MAKKRGNNIFNYFGAKRFSRECCVQKDKIIAVSLVVLNTYYFLNNFPDVTILFLYLSN